MVKSTSSRATKFFRIETKDGDVLLVAPSCESIMYPGLTVIRRERNVFGNVDRAGSNVGVSLHSFEKIKLSRDRRVIPIALKMQAGTCCWPGM